MRTAEEYLDEQFPKGKTKFRGQAMVLLALAREEGRFQAIDDNLTYVNKKDLGEYQDIIDYLKQKIAKLQNHSQQGKSSKAVASFKGPADPRKRKEKK